MALKKVTSDWHCSQSMASRARNPRRSQQSQLSTRTIRAACKASGSHRVPNIQPLKNNPSGLDCSAGGRSCESLCSGELSKERVEANHRLTTILLNTGSTAVNKTAVTGINRIGPVLCHQLRQQSHNVAQPCTTSRQKDEKTVLAVLLFKRAQGMDDHADRALRDTYDKARCPP